MELQRIKRIVRRRWAPDVVDRLQSTLTDALKTRAGTQRLFRLQAIALAEAVQLGGAYIPIPVGGGKTLVSFLIPRLIRRIERPLILTYAHLIPKTEAEALEYRKDWALPVHYKIESYQTLSRKGAARYLSEYRPDYIFCDESQALKNPSASVTSKVERYVKHCRDTRFPLVFCAGSGSPWATSIRDMAHVVSWCIPHTNPCPADYGALDEWARCLDADVPPLRRLDPGALLQLEAEPAPPFADPHVRARRAFGFRFAQTPGVVMAEPEQLPIPIVIREIPVQLEPCQIEAYEGLRKGVTPDGIDIADGPSHWRHAREINTGFYGVWEPRPPMDWREARRAWCSACRHVLQTNRRDLDSEEQLTDYLAEHPDHYPEAAEALAAWREIEPTFIPNVVYHWLTDRTLRQIADWAAQGPGLIWTDRPEAANRLSALSGLPYYGRGGLDARTGRTTIQHPPGQGAIILARRANDSGLNLQAWNRNLVVDVPSGAVAWEQMIGRTHRTGQTARSVTFDVLVGCREDVLALNKAARRAAVVMDSTTLPQKLCHADLSAFPSDEEIEEREGPQWRTWGRKDRA